MTPLPAQATSHFPSHQNLVNIIILALLISRLSFSPRLLQSRFCSQFTPLKRLLSGSPVTSTLLSPVIHSQTSYYLTVSHVWGSSPLPSPWNTFLLLTSRTARSRFPSFLTSCFFLNPLPTLPLLPHPLNNGESQGKVPRPFLLLNLCSLPWPSHLVPRF